MERLIWIRNEGGDEGRELDAKREVGKPLTTHSTDVLGKVDLQLADAAQAQAIHHHCGQMTAVEVLHSLSKTDESKVGQIPFEVIVGFVLWYYTCNRRSMLPLSRCPIGAPLA